MNPWWRRPAAEDGPVRAKAKRGRAPAPVEQKEESETGKEPAAEPDAQAVAEAPEESAAAESARADDSSSLLVDAEPPAEDAEAGGDAPEAVTEPAVQEDAAPAAAGGKDAGEGHVSPALEAATEPAKPARTATADEDKPAPAKRRRRRRRRGGRGRGRGQPAQPDGESSVKEKTAPAAAERRRAASPQAGRGAVLLDLGALQRDLGEAAVLDPEGLFARLDGDLGKLVLRRVYADARDGDLDRAALHRGGTEVVDVPSNPEERGCSAAVRIVVDALELCYTKRGVNTMVLVASSIQMLPLVAKLQQNGVTVIGLGGAGANAQVRGQCDRFIDLGG